MIAAMRKRLMSALQRAGSLRFPLLGAAGLLIVVLALSAWPRSGRAQELAPARADCFGNAESASTLLRLSVGITQELMESRGGLPSAGLQPDLGEACGALERTKAWLRSQPTEDAVILMGRDGVRHSVYIIDAAGVRGSGSVRIPTTDLSGMIEQWRASAGVEGAIRGRRAAVARRPGDDVAPQASRTGSHPGRSALERLARVLLPGEVRQVALRYQHLYIVPYGDLGIVPYAALPSGIGSTQLVDQVSISIAPSADVILGRDVVAFTHSGFQRACPNAPRGQESVVVGNPVVPPDPDWRFPALPGAELEARRVARALGVSPLIGRDATGARLLESARQAQYVHLASHGVANSTAPLDQSFLALSDGRLTAREVQNLCIPARLVVLSGCRTGLGRQHAGGIIGLTRAFEIAGAHEVVMSMWSVDDAATERLMTDFWTKFLSRRRNETASDVLRASMLDLRREQPDPRLWAPFMVFGVPSTEGT